jgi:hypothetical protein
MKRNIKYYPVTQGHIFATWHMLYLASQYKNILPRTAIEIAATSGKLGGTFPAKQGLKICLDYGLLRISDIGTLQITEITEYQILPNCSDEDANFSALRAILFHIISFHNFEWLIFYDSEPGIFREYLSLHDIEWTNLLDNARLFDFEDTMVIAWWEGVLTKYEDYKEKLKKAVGDVGEKLTYQRELKRIESDGINPSKSFVKWASRISDRFGFDIQSIRGTYFKSTYSERDKIQIEVKSTDTDNLERFRFFVSKPEWIKASENINSYFFFCWAGVNLLDETARYGPYIIPATYLQKYVPVDMEGVCEWSECRVVLNISDFT